MLSATSKRANSAKTKLAIGLMSGTSLDGIDAVLVEIDGFYKTTKVKELGFLTFPFPPLVRQRLLKIVEGDYGGSKELCNMNFLLGKLFADASSLLCKNLSISPTQIDFVGTHGQTVWHSPAKVNYQGYDIRSTMQLGEPSFLCELCHCPVVSDFRVRDMCAGGLGAPLVPYTEFLLYRSEEKTIALQNIGGIGNVTILPANCSLDDVIAFDTGPGNMVMDAIVLRITNGLQSYDNNGAIAKQGNVDDALIELLLDDPFFMAIPPKTSGRENYGKPYVDKLFSLAKERNISDVDLLATATMLTAKSIAIGINLFSGSPPKELIIGGGGAANPVLMQFIRESLVNTVVLRNEDIGFNSDSKEAVAFAVLANEALHSVPNNAATATGAHHSVVMGKISQW